MVSSGSPHLALKKNSESLLDHSLAPYFDELAKCNSSGGLFASAIYKKLENEIRRLETTPEYGLYATDSQPAKNVYRVVAWNIERGMRFDGVLDTLKSHQDLSSADFFCLTETDIGMSRTQNRNVAHDLALQLKMNYFYGNSYINLCKGNTIESHIEGKNEKGMHGNAFLSRYPIENLRLVPLKNGKDKMCGHEKRLGHQNALVVDVILPQRKVTMVVAHLDAHASQRHRGLQMKTILESINNNPYPVIVAGDLNTSGYDTSCTAQVFFSFLRKVFYGVGSIIKDHFPYPDRVFDKYVFDVFREYGFDYESFNELGVGTLHYRVADERVLHLMEELAPRWALKVSEAILKRYGGIVSLKLDWFAGKGVRVASKPKVISGLNDNNGRALSDHDAILLDFCF